LFAFASAGYLLFFFPAFAGAISSLAALLILVLMAVNLLGIKESSRLNSLLTVVVILVLLVLAIIGFGWSFDIDKFAAGIVPIGQNPGGWESFLYSITLAMVTFVGIESISQGAEETKEPHKIIPKATMLAIAVVLFFAMVFSVLSLGIVSPQTLKENMNNPFIPVVQAMPFANILVPIIAFAGFLVCFVSANTGIIGVSRVAYSMSNTGLISRRIQWVHPKFRTPWITIVIFSIIAMVLAFTGDMIFLGELYAFGALAAYSVTNFSLVALRIKEPNLHRPFKMPLNLKIAGREISLISLVGIISCLAVFALVALLHVEGRNFAFIWFALGALYFVAYKRYRKTV
ncbi:MAG: APC family permease, partial [Candidatus Anstonellaceae archaeon]